jgi:hypothetical protein
LKPEAPTAHSTSWELRPGAGNRITLSNTCDSFGLPQCRLYWRRSADDKISPRTAALALGRYLANNDSGRIRFDRWILEEDDAYPEHDEPGALHHMGGTRMADSEASGVVDRNCRVFGCKICSLPDRACSRPEGTATRR